jgi:hypothetical protein
MDLKKYDELRKKLNKKDFENRNKGLDKWLFRFSYVGNVSAIFFAYFLVYPSLLKAITLNFITGFWGVAISFLFSITFLTIFEITKRYFIRNFSHEYEFNDKKITPQVSGWFTLSIIIIALSFYLSITGSKNLASTSQHKNNIVETNISTKIDSLNNVYNKKINVYDVDNNSLRKVNIELRNTLAQTPIYYISARKEYQASIDKNVKIIDTNQEEVNKLNIELNNKINELKNNLTLAKTGNETEDYKNIFLFVIIVIFNEVIIIGGILFREYFEAKLFEINKLRFEKIYQKKDRYKALLTYIYNNGKANVGDKVISGMELKEIVKDKTNLSDGNKIVDNFLKEMDTLGIFNTVGKRRFIASTYADAMNIIEHFDDVYKVFENLK